MPRADTSLSAKIVSATVARTRDGGSVIQPSRAEAEDAVRVLLRWIGEDPTREGLAETPKRVVASYDEYFGGYNLDPAEILSRTFEEVDGYDEMVVLRGIDFQSHCEHHMVPIVGKAYVAYLPERRVVGISKLARVVDAFARRLQIQERMTAQIANTIQDVLQPLGVAIVLVSEHQCMTTRGVKKPDTTMATSRMLGAFKENPSLRREFQALAGIG